MSISVINSSIDHTPQGSVIIRGSIDPESLYQLKVGDYQREVLGIEIHNKLVTAIQGSVVPDIELGSRSATYKADGKKLIIDGPVFIIDGLQRVSAAKLMIERSEVGVPYIGVMVHMNTTEEWERERFRILNMDRTKLSPNVLLRNMKETNLAVALAWDLTETEDEATNFVLANRVTWKQKPKVSDLITASMLIKVMGRLHSHLGRTKSSTLSGLVPAMEAMLLTVGEEVVRDNTVYYFGMVDECFNIRDVHYRGAPYLSSTFMISLARLLSEHSNLWRGDRLFVEAPLVRKLKLFKINDPQVGALCRSGGSSSDILYMMLVEHMNSGKRTKQLARRIENYPAARPGKLDSPEEN